MSKKIQCMCCGKVLESKYRHDFVSCDCSNQTFLDGGDDYRRCGGIDMDKIRDVPDDEDSATSEMIYQSSRS